MSYINEVTLEWPIYEYQVKPQPYSGFTFDLPPNIAKVLPTNRPAVTLEITTEEGNPEYRDGAWHQVWLERPSSEKEISAKSILIAKGSI